MKKKQLGTTQVYGRKVARNSASVYAGKKVRNQEKKYRKKVAGKGEGKEGSQGSMHEKTTKTKKMCMQNKCQGTR